MMTFKERCCLTLAARPEYQWYCLTLLMLLLCGCAWWYMIYKTWHYRRIQLVQEAAVMQVCQTKGKGAEEQSVPPDKVHYAVEHASQLGLTVSSVTTAEQNICGNHLFVPSEVVLVGSFEQFIAYCNHLYTDPWIFIRRCELQLLDDGSLRMSIGFVGCAKA